MHGAPLTLYHKAHFQYFILIDILREGTENISTFIIAKFGCGKKMSTIVQFLFVFKYHIHHSFYNSGDLK